MAQGQPKLDLAWSLPGLNETVFCYEDAVSTFWVFLFTLDSTFEPLLAVLEMVSLLEAALGESGTLVFSVLLKNRSKIT